MIVKKTLPEGYRLVPSFSVPDTENARNGLNHQGRPAQPCGLGANVSLSDRIKSCKRVNGNSAVWSAQQGNGGESDWKLVTLTPERVEVWYDARTKLIWSDLADASSNWCEASGNSEDNCKAIGDNVSVCVNRSTVDPLHGLSNIVWRLPTRNEYLQGEVDGLRAVLKDEAAGIYWSATLNSAGLTKAWTYDQHDGTIGSSALTDTLKVRCVGTSLR
jgi:hypothetical protein